jgi:hypothetical protein
MENEKEFTAQESFQLIQSMIDKTKLNFAESSSHFLIWGWLAFTICIAQYILLVGMHSEHHFYVWFFIWIGVFMEVITSLRNKKKAKVHTYVGDSMKYLWTGLGITFFVTAVLCGINHWINSFPLFIILYGIGTFVSGSILQFTPFKIGGVLCWCIALVAATLAYEWQILLTSVALLVSYIIPGHLLRNQYQQK